MATSSRRAQPTRSNMSGIVCAQIRLRRASLAPAAIYVCTIHSAALSPLSPALSHAAAIQLTRRHQSIMRGLAACPVTRIALHNRAMRA
jgi:hypothetical protein